MEILPMMVIGLLLVMVSLWAVKFSRRAPPGDALPRNFVVERTPEVLTARYRWGGTLDYLIFLLYSSIIGLVVVDALAEQSRYPTRIGALLGYTIIVLPIGYVFLVVCLNRTVFRITREEITATTGPLPAWEPDRCVKVGDLEGVVCRWHGMGGGSYEVYGRPRSGKAQTIADGYWGPSVPVAVARLIVEMAPSLRLDLELESAAVRRARRRQ